MGTEDFGGSDYPTGFESGWDRQMREVTQQRADAWDAPEGQTHHQPGRLLGLHGLAGAGKSTIAQALIEGGAAALLHLAGPLKNMMRAIGLTESEINGAGKQTPHPLLCGRTPRHAMQTLGTEWGRGCIGESFWLDLAMRDVDRLLAHGLDVILDDVRFPNEAAAVWERGGVVIQLTGRESVTSSSHASESVLPERWIHDRIPNLAPIAEVARAVRYCWHDTIACVGASRAW